VHKRILDMAQKAADLEERALRERSLLTTMTKQHSLQQMAPIPSKNIVYQLGLGARSGISGGSLGSHTQNVRNNVKVGDIDWSRDASGSSRTPSSYGSRGRKSERAEASTEPPLPLPSRTPLPYPSRTPPPPPPPPASMYGTSATLQY
jgi:hypothetical protein